MRREFPTKVRVAAFQRADGKCEKCSARLTVGKFAYDHRIADAIGGEPTLENCEVLCVGCHGEKTPIDIRAAAKIKRITRKHIGAHQTRRPMAGSKASGWRHRMDGSWEKRD